MLAALQDATLLTYRPLFCKVKTAILDHELPLPWNGGNMASLEQSHLLEQSQVFDVVLRLLTNWLANLAEERKRRPSLSGNLQPDKARTLDSRTIRPTGLGRGMG